MRWCAGRPRPAVLFDLLGLARSVAFLPWGWCGPYLLVLHGLEVWRPLSRLDLRMLNRAYQRLAFSTHTRERAWRFVGDGASSIEVLPLALEERSPDGTADAALLDRLGTGFLLMAGRMSVSERYKGHDQVLKAFAEVAGRLPDAHLVIAGGGDDRARLEAGVADSRLASRVTFAGFVTEATLHELYRRCAAFVMPSRGEGFGLVYLEAMRAVKPCLAATGSAAEEIVVAGETGVLVDPDDERALAQAMIRLLSDAALATRLGQAGRVRWQQHFSLQHFQSGLEQYLDRLTVLDHVRH
jgi:phosphatidylinositol alpha-1,6-mannosyltransferase